LCGFYEAVSINSEALSTKECRRDIVHGGIELRAFAASFDIVRQKTRFSCVRVRDLFGPQYSSPGSIPEKQKKMNLGQDVSPTPRIPRAVQLAPAASLPQTLV